MNNFGTMSKKQTAMLSSAELYAAVCIKSDSDHTNRSMSNMIQDFGISVINVGYTKKPCGKITYLFTALDSDKKISSNTRESYQEAIHDLYLQLPVKETPKLQLMADIDESANDEEDEE